MSPSKREREYARRRYSDWQQRLAEKKARRRRIQIILAVVAAVMVPVVVVGFMWWQDRDEKDPATAEPSASQTDGADPENPCPPVEVTPPAEPLQFPAAPDPAVAEGRTWTATVTTTCGEIGLELDGALAPQAVANFVQLSKDSFFDSTPCHRLVPDRHLRAAVRRPDRHR